MPFEIKFEQLPAGYAAEPALHPSQIPPLLFRMYSLMAWLLNRTRLFLSDAFFPSTELRTAFRRISSRESRPRSSSSSVNEL